jgi:hypothetical protein
MTNLSISVAWNETASFVKRNFGALSTIAFAFVALPSVAMQALGPAQVAPGQDPQLGWWLLLFPVVLLLSIVGTLAISALALNRENVVGDAIKLGFRRFPAVFGASLLVGLAALLLMIPAVLVLGLRAAELSNPNPAGAGRIALAFLLFFLIFMFIWVRLMLMTPAATAESGGPISILRRSWELTSGRFWKLLGFALLFVLAGAIVIISITMVIGILVALFAGPPAPGSVSALLMLLLGGICNALFVLFFTTMLSRIYVQLTGRTSGT